MAEPTVVRSKSRPTELPSDLPCSACGANVGKHERTYHLFIRHERVIVCFPCANRVGNSYWWLDDVSCKYIHGTFSVQFVIVEMSEFVYR
jgi:hypothetical protein